MVIGFTQLFPASRLFQQLAHLFWMISL